MALLGVACAGAHTPVADAVRVVAVPMNVSGAVPPKCRLPFGEDGLPCPDVGDAVALSPVQASVLQAVLDDPTTWGGDEGKCSLPLHGFAWLGADGALQGQVAVSLLCDKVEGAPGVPGQPSDPGTRGLSAAGVMSLRAVCVEVGLPHCHITKPGEAFGG
jgi:hypothetical protein